MSSNPQLEGDWDASKEHMACGYTAVWRITVKDEENIVIKEQPGSHCCGCVPNCFLKTHHMKKVCWYSDDMITSGLAFEIITLSGFAKTMSCIVR